MQKNTDVISNLYKWRVLFYEYVSSIVNKNIIYQFALVSNIIGYRWKCVPGFIQYYTELVIP